MSTCKHVVRGAAAEMRGAAANDNLPAADAAMLETGTNVVGIERHRQPGPVRDYDDVLTMVCAEMRWTSP